VIDKIDMLKIQQQYISPTEVSELEVIQFLQAVLETRNTRNYALVVLLAYAGL
jgi:integrase/recombinase XerD